MGKRYALLGAGFSRNWGAWLAPELVGELCGRVADDDDLVRRLTKNRNFEVVLAEARAEATRGLAEQARYERLERAVVEAFEGMNQMLAAQRFEFNMHEPYWVLNFLASFDAIFTLNQDLLLELHYFPGSHVPERRRWAGTTFPGIGPPVPMGAPIEQRLGPRDAPDVATMEVDPKEQPIYKLHGSVNWFTAGGSRVMVVGGSKGTAIRGNSVLNAYFEAFQRCLNSDGARLMVIGYSFSDMHINEALATASTEHRLKTYIVNPAGLSVFDPPPSQLIRPTNELLSSLRIVGISTRPFSEAFRSDALTFESFQRFLRD